MWKVFNPRRIPGRKQSSLLYLLHCLFTLHVLLFNLRRPFDWAQRCLTSPQPGWIGAWRIALGLPPVFFRTTITPDYERVQRLMAFFSPLCCRLSMHWTRKTMNTRRPSPLWRRPTRRKCSRSSPRPGRRYYRFGSPRFHLPKCSLFLLLER